jgi:hypothetical protein
LSFEDGEGGVGAVSEGEDEALLAMEALFRDLELGDFVDEGVERRSLAPEFESFLELPPEQFRNVAQDLSVVCGVSGDWNLALKFVQRLLALGDDRLELKIWQLRCAVEVENFAESLALANAVRWPPEWMIHVNYLTALAYEGLGMKEQAKIRLQAVRNRDASYRDVKQRLEETE